MAGAESESFSKGRVEAFSDGVFAILVTLLVLELKVPAVPAGQHHSAPALLAALLGLLPKFGSWVVSFLIVCVTWVNHHRVMAMFRRLDAGVFWLNAHLLLWLSFIPFPTALMGDFLRNPLALSFFGVALGIASLAFALLRLYALRHPELLLPEVSLPAYRASTRRSILLGPLPYALGAGLAWLWAPGALLLYGLVPAYFITQDAARSR